MNTTAQWFLAADSRAAEKKVATDQNKKNKSLSSTIDRLESKISSIQSDLDSLGCENYSYHEQVTRLQGEIMTMKGKSVMDKSLKYTVYRTSMK